ncbi:hypothetical protein [Maritalea sp.]|uniref:hypothetical protein n=1 Tax=Maritalea sp. TaxID=2003361 RepID=UPI003EF33F13
MGFINELLGNVDNNVWVLAGGLAITVVAIILVVWLLKFAFNASRNGLGGRIKRLGVVSTAAVDNKRQLVIIRRDNKEHLIMIGGPTDVVIETGINPDETVSQKVPNKRAVSTGEVTTAPKKQTRVEPVPAQAAPKSPQPVTASQPSQERQQPMPRPTPRIVPSPEPKNVVLDPETNVTAIEKLRELGKSTPESTVSTLRYPGILRPVTRHKGVDRNELDEINTDQANDSDKLTVQEAPKIDVVQGADSGKDDTKDAPKKRGGKPAKGE